MGVSIIKIEERHGTQFQIKDKWGFIASEQNKENHRNGKLLREDVKCRGILTETA